MDNISEKKANNRICNLRIIFRVAPEERNMIERRMAQTGIKNMRADAQKRVQGGFGGCFKGKKYQIAILILFVLTYTIFPSWAFMGNSKGCAKAC